jgi:hypothetical protein
MGYGHYMLCTRCSLRAAERHYIMYIDMLAAKVYTIAMNTYRIQ